MASFYQHIDKSISYHLWQNNMIRSFLKLQTKTRMTKTNGHYNILIGLYYNAFQISICTFK